MSARGHRFAATLPPAGLPGLDASWSRLVTAPDGDGVPRTWHLLDNAARLAELGVEPTGTILCVHGNPTWSYLWRAMLAAATDAAGADSADADGSAGASGVDGTAGVDSTAGVEGAAGALGLTGAPVWRVIAVDQLEMGFSERSGETRGLPRRIRDLGALTEALGVDGPVVTLGHDWGGVVSLGWAVDHPESLAGVMLLNTAVHQPSNAPLPAALRLVLRHGMLDLSTVRTTGFLDTTLAIAHPSLDADVRHAFRSPYRSASRREGIGAFVADIPVDASHPSFAELARVSAGVAKLRVPATMIWGPRDPVFSDRYLGDLVARLPHADVTRFESAGHLVGEDIAYAPLLLQWLSDHFAPAPRADADGFVEAAKFVGVGGSNPQTSPSGWVGDGGAGEWRPLWTTIDELAAGSAAEATAVVEMAPRGRAGNAREAGSAEEARSVADTLGARGMAVTHGARVVSWRLLAQRVNELATGLVSIGVAKGDRVSLLVPPGADLTAVVYACLRIGAVIVVADAGLGLKGLGRAVRGAHPDHIIGIETALAAARTLGWPGQKISAKRLPPPIAAALRVSHSLGNVARLGRQSFAAEAVHPAPVADDVAAILFTSGSTGPAKGVVYTHRQLSALVEVLRIRFGVGVGTGLVAGFAPFALLGPALGATSVTPDMDVTSPKTLTATAVAEAALAVDATVVFASPAALTNVLATSAELSLKGRRALGRVQTLLSAGAPLPVPLLERVQALVPEASIHTPYGMTEGLLMTDITLGGIRAAELDALAAAEATHLPEAPRRAPGGVCVGLPVNGVEIRISALDAEGSASGALTLEPHVTGEIVVAAAHLKDHYDQLWATERESRRDRTPRSPRWHRTGDVGHLDPKGRLWVEGRLPHVIVTADGVLTPVGPEQCIERLPGVRRAAIVGVGPRGTAQVVAVVEIDPTAAAGTLGIGSDAAFGDGAARDAEPRVVSATPRVFGRGPFAPGVALAPTALTAAVRQATGLPVAAVLVVRELPTDVRHNSKIDRGALGIWAAGVLAGGARRRP